MQRTIAQLKKAAGKLGVSPTQFTGRGGKEAKRDWVNALGDYYQYQAYGANAPWGLVKRRQWRSTMLAFLFNHLSDQEARDVMSGSDWIFERKVDGVRMQLFWGPGGSFQAFSRNISVEDYLPVDYTSKIKLPPFPDTLGNRSIVLDCEVQCVDPKVNTALNRKGVVTETVLQATSAILAMNTEDSLAIQRDHQLVFYPFDVLHYNGKDILQFPWHQRRQLLEQLGQHFKHFGFPFEILPAIKENRKEYLDDLLAKGEEGVIAKNIHSPYTADESRSRKRWIKIKRTMSQALSDTGHGDSIDAFVTGFSLGTEGSGWEGLIGSLDLSMNIITSAGEEYQHMIARVSNIPLETRKAITVKDDQGNITLDPSWMGKVLEVDGQDVSAREKRLTHARIIRERPDRSIFECVMMEEDLNRFVL